MDWMLAKLRTWRDLTDSARADVILAATQAVIPFLLACWLLAWLVLVHPRTTLLTRAELPDPVDTAAPVAAWLGPSGIDLIRKAFGDHPRPNVSEVDGVDAIRQLLAAGSDASTPLIIYYAAPSGLCCGEPATPKLECAVQIVNALLSRAGQRKILLLLDIGQLGPEVGEGPTVSETLTFLASRYQTNPDAWKGIRILASCGPGQPSLPIEARQTSLFAASVAEALPRAGRARALVERVQALVADRAQRLAPGARQIPFSMGDESLDFAIPIARVELDDSTASAPWETPLARQVGEEVARLQETREALERRSASRDPVAWRAFLEALLNAERLYRAGRFEQAREAIRRVQELAAGSFPHPSFVDMDSLAAGLRYAGDAQERGEFQELQRQLEETLKTPEPSRPAPDSTDPEPKPAADPAPEPRPDSSSSAAPSRDSLLTLIAAGRNPWERYLEGRLISRAIVYSSLRPEFVEDLRQTALGEVFREAVRVESLAARATLEVMNQYARLARMVEQGDEARRRAIDNLFLADLALITEIRKDLAQARRSYEHTIQYGRALDLIGRVLAELPFLAGWEIREGIGGRRGTHGVMVDVSRDLAARLDQELGRESTTGGYGSRDSLLQAIEALGRDFDKLLESYRGQVSAIVAESEPTDSKPEPTDPGRHFWSELDSLLGVPTGIEARQRATLIDRARTLSLRALPPPPPKTDGVLDYDQLTDRAEDAVQGDLSLWTLIVQFFRGGRKSAPKTADLPPIVPHDARSGPDTNFESQSLGLLTLQFDLIRIAIGHAGLRIEDFDPPYSLERLNKLRQRLIAALPDGTESAESPPPAPRAPLLLARAALPPRLTIQPNSAPKGTPQGYDYRWAVWDAERHRQDLDFERARKRLKLVPEGAGGEKLDAVGWSIAALSDSKAFGLTVTEDESPRPRQWKNFRVRISNDPAVIPPGRAYLQVTSVPNAQAGSRLWVLPRPDSKRTGPGVQLGADAASALYRVTRNSNASTGVEFGSPVQERLKASLFYRGHWCDPAEVRVTLDQLDGGTILLKSDLSAAKAIGISKAFCQLKNHPEKVCIYENSEHSFFVYPRLASTDEEAVRRPRRVKIRASIAGHWLAPLESEPFEVRPVENPEKLPTDCLVKIDASGSAEIVTRPPKGTGRTVQRRSALAPAANRPVGPLVLVIEAFGLPEEGDGDEILLAQRELTIQRLRAEETIVHRGILDGSPDRPMLRVEVTRNEDGIGQPELKVAVDCPTGTPVAGPIAPEGFGEGFLPGKRNPVLLPNRTERFTFELKAPPESGKPVFYWIHVLGRDLKGEAVAESPSPTASSGTKP